MVKTDTVCFLQIMKPSTGIKPGSGCLKLFTESPEVQELSYLVVRICRIIDEVNEWFETTVKPEISFEGFNLVIDTIIKK